MKKFRTDAEYKTIYRALIAELTKKPKHELVHQLAWELVKTVMQEDFDADLQAVKLIQVASETKLEKLRAIAEKGRDDYNQTLLERLIDAPKALARRGGPGKKQINLEPRVQKYAFLDKQTDIASTHKSRTEILAKRLDQQFGITSRKPPKEGEASGPAKTLVRDWKKYRSLCQQIESNLPQDTTQQEKG